MKVEATENAVREKEKLLINHRLGYHAYFLAFLNCRGENSLVEIVQDVLQLFDAPIDHFYALLIPLSLVLYLEVSKRSLENRFTMLFLQLLQSLPLLHTIALVDVVGKIELQPFEELFFLLFNAFALFALLRFFDYDFCFFLTKNLDFDSYCVFC